MERTKLTEAKEFVLKHLREISITDITIEVSQEEFDKISETLNDEAKDHLTSSVSFNSISALPVGWLRYKSHGVSYFVKVKQK